ncbi:MAG TPA: EamA family transporter [Kiritimatiellia bacterium]|nr:EamA family transporter [Kiritimatiellia bacterium]HRZ12198.1 EamA family transporter [Kiritimatiellia bacterium]HSA18044.1 EamA family transporter [Kiritimatiellia bacterium]
MAGHLWLLLGIGLFSSVEVASKWVGRGIPPLWLAVARFSLTGLLLMGPAVFALRRREADLTWRDAGRFLVLALIGVTLSIGLYHLAIPRMRANSAAILFSANPAFVVLFSPWLLGERPGRRKIAGMLCGLAGVALFLSRPAAGLDTRAGIVLMTASLILFALYSVLAKREMPRFGPLPILSLAGLAGSALLVPLAWWREGPPGPALAHLSWPGFLYLTLCATAIAYVAYFSGLQRLGAARGSFYFFLKPVLASLIAWLWLGERLTPQLVIGAAFVLAGLALTMMPGPRAQR